MKVRHIDHLNLHIPVDGVERAREFYGDTLGFGIEDSLYEVGEKSFFDVRLAPQSVLHLRPVEDFEPPERRNFDHVCLVLDETIADVKARLAEADVEIEKESEGPMGATGAAPAVYVRDPFGYRLELKERV